MTIPGRTCGDCTLCCKLLGVSALNKRAGVWCNVVQIGKGCSDYARRPDQCRDFECLWLVSTMPDEYRPDRIKAVFAGNKDGSVSVIYIDPATPDYWRTGPVATLIEMMFEKFDVIVVSGDKRTLLKRQ